MAIQKREVEFSKEIDDVAVFNLHLLKAIKDKKPIAEIMSGSLKDLMDAVQGIDQMDDEAKSNRKVALQTIGYRAGEMADVLLPVGKSVDDGPIL